MFDSKPLPITDKIAGDMAWSDIPTCKSQGLDIEYLMLRGVFMPAGAPKDAVDYYVELFKKVRATPEWKQLMQEGAFNQTFMTGADYAKWVEGEDKRHVDLMREAGFLANAPSGSDDKKWRHARPGRGNAASKWAWPRS